jgi:hypothetical protein
MFNHLGQRYLAVAAFDAAFCAFLFRKEKHKK